LHHQISNKIRLDPFCSHLTHDFSVRAVKGKRDANLLTVITPNFKAIRTPTDVTFVNRDRALMLSRIYRPAAVAIGQQVVIPHYAINPFGADALNSVVDTLVAQVDTH
jgi:hypothetical protein